MHEVRLQIPARAEYIVLCRLALTGIARVCETDGEVLADLKLALTEACSNSIRHAYDGGEGSVDVSYAFSSDRITVEIADAGPGFELTNGDDRAEIDEGGLGMSIIRALVDELAIESGRKGSRVRLTKFLV